jgi:hypothetical protein
MANDKNIRVVIPADFNKKLNLYLIDIRDLGVKITKAELIIRLAGLGLKVEKKEIEFSSDNN